MSQNPTVEQIASLCAALAKGKEPADKLAARAIEIWRAAESAVASQYPEKLNVTERCIAGID
jgi:hypothetical protein